MATFWSGLKKRLVLDIGTSAVRLCELSKTKTGFEVTNYVQQEYNSDPSLEEAFRHELRTNAIREVLKQAKTRKRKVIIGVPGQSVFTRCRALPPVPEYKVSQIVRYEIQQQIPFGLDQIAMDYQVLGQTEQGGYDVMMAAIKVDVVEKHLEALKPFKSPVAVVDVLPLAAYNWLKYRHQFGEQGDCVALIDLGATTTDIIIERGLQFRFTRPLNIGGNDITKALAEAFNMDFVSAERIKRERCFAPTGDPNRDGKAGEVVGKVLQRLSNEITRSFSYFRSLPGGGQVNRIILTGGGARLKNVAAYLHNQLGLDVKIAQPLADVQVSKAAQAIMQSPEQATIALGMALRCLEPVTIDINLIPPRILEAARHKEQALYWALSICALVLIFASIVPAAANRNELVKGRIEELKRGIRGYDPELVQRIRPGTSVPQSGLKHQLDVRKQHLQTLEGHVRVLDQARRQRRFWLDEIAFVNEARPTMGQIWFSSLETTRFPEEGDTQQPGGPGGGRGLRGGAGLPGASGGMQTTPGFPGIEPTGGAAARPSGMGRDRQGREPEKQEVNRAAIPIPNGVIIQGFAESDKVIYEFLQGLRMGSRQLPNSWFLSAEQVSFSEASVRRVPWDVLYDTTKAGSAAAKGDSAIPAGASALYTFTVEVRFRRTQDRPAPVEEQAAEGGAA